MKNTLTKSVVFIPGTFIGNNCWDEWKTYFEGKGYRCMAPPWPYKDALPEELRNRHPDSAVASNRLADLTAYYAKIVNALPEKPIMIGHSLGGLIVQLLLQRGCGMAGIAMHSFPATGVCGSKFSFLKALWRAMVFFTSPQKTYMISYRRWKHTIANGMTCEEQKELFYKYAIPESKLIVRDAFKPTEKIHFEKAHPPLLFVSGGCDQIISASMNFDNYRNYETSSSITDYKDFKGSNHLVFGHPAWREEADFIIHWLQGIV